MTVPLSADSREYVRLEFAHRANKIASRHREAIQKINQLAPRSGAAQVAVDREQFESLSEMVDAKISLHIEAHERENEALTDTDIDQICAQIDEMVRAARQSPFRTHLASSQDKYMCIVPRARLELASASKRIKISQRQAALSQPKVVVPVRERLFIEDIDSFAEVQGIAPGAIAELLSNGYLDVPEDIVQRAIEAILNVPMHKVDWGGETNDLYTTNLIISGRRRETAFLLKGNGLRKSVMEIRDCGKNGDQILRLVESPALLFVIQFVGNVSENVIRDIAGKVAHLRSQGRDAQYCIIDGQDTARLLRAYGKL